MAKRIIIHWTAGSYIANITDRNHYHFIVEETGRIINGRYKVEDNNNCNDGYYAQHTGGGNTQSIGIAFAGMLNYKVGNVKSTSYPITARQFEAGMKKVAQLCKEYNIKITRDTVLTHYEFGLSHPQTTSAGKIDITYLPPFPTILPNQVGDFIRNKVKWYYERL